MSCHCYWKSDDEGRIVAEILRNSDKDTAEGAGGRHDYQVRSIIGCPNLNCNGYKNDPNYANPNYNSEYIAGNLDSYDRGLGQLPTGLTYKQLLEANAKKDPVGTTAAGLGIIGLGYLTGGTGTAVGVKVFGAGVGGFANYAFQPSGQPTDWIDVGIAGGTGFITSGSGLGSSILTNAGGALAGSGLKGENPNAGMGGATVGTVFGYGLGKGIELPIGRKIDPQNWWRPAWIDLGFGVSRPNTANAIPGMAGGIGSSFLQEPAGNAIKNELQQRRGQ